MQNEAQENVENLVNFLQEQGHMACIVGSRVLARAEVLDREPNDWDVAIPFVAHKEAIKFLENRGWTNNPDDERMYYGVSLLGFLKKDGYPSIDLVSSDLTYDLIDGLYIKLKNAVSFAIKHGGAMKKLEILEIAIKFPQIEELGAISRESMAYARRRIARKKKDG